MTPGFKFATAAISAILLAPTLHAQTWHCGVSPAATQFRVDVAPDHAGSKGCSSSHSFLISAAVAEGNYLVTVELGGEAAATTTVKAEARRLMILNAATKAGGTRKERFVVNVRQPIISPGVEVKRKPREIKSLDWDSRLSLEFSGNQPSLRSVTIEPAPASTPTIYLAGDSTVVDQANEPWAAWGQMLPSFFKSDIAVSNHAESGETVASFEGERRFAKIFSTIKAGDFLFLQFAHNDQKPGSGYVAPEKYTALLHKYITMAREKGATPILVTSMNRRTFDSAGKITDTLAPYPQLTRTAAEADHVALLDLNAMSKTLYEAIGEPNSRSLFVYAAANTYPDQHEALHDDTHFNNYGAYELARCIVWAIQQQRLPLAKFLKSGIPWFDPSRPDAATVVALPPSPFYDTEKPYER